MRMTKTNILSIAMIATGIAITILTIHVYNMEHQSWCGYTKTLITLLTGIAFILIGIAGLMKTRNDLGLTPSPAKPNPTQYGF